MYLVGDGGGGGGGGGGVGAEGGGGRQPLAHPGRVVLLVY